MTAPNQPNHRAVLGTLACCGVLVAIMQTLVVPLLPSLPRLTGSSPDDVSWTVTITLLTGAVFTPLLGRAGDMYGKRRVLLLALASMVVGSLFCATSTHLPLLIVGRALQGAAVAVVPLGISILRDVVPPQRVIPSIAVMSATLGVGAAFGIPVATAVIEYSDWHTMFWVSAGLGVIVIIAVAAIVPESSLHTSGSFDFVGTAGLSGFLVCLLLVVSKGGSWGWGHPLTLVLILAAVVIAPLWVWHQVRAPAPLVDVAVSIRPAVLFTNLSALLVGFAFYANSLTTAQLVQVPTFTGYGLGGSIFTSGLCLLPSGVTMVILSPISGRISTAWGPRFTLLIATVILAAGYVVRLFTSHSFAGIVVGSTVVAAGTAVAYSTLPTLIMQAVPVTETAAANGLNTLMRTIGQAVCSAIVAMILASIATIHDGHSQPTLGAFYLVFAISGVAAVGALVLTLLIPSKRSAAKSTAVAAAVS